MVKLRLLSVWVPVWAATLVTVTALLCEAARAADRGVANSVQKLLDKEEEMHVRLDTHLIDSLKEMQATPAGQGDPDLVETSLMRTETRVNDDKNLMIENHLRIEFLNQFISALEASSGDARTEAPHILIDLAHKQILSSIETSNDGKLWLFEIYLSVAIRDIMEPSENFADFIQNYMLYSSLREPRSPAEFLQNRKYLGGHADRTSKAPVAPPLAADEKEESGD